MHGLIKITQSIQTQYARRDWQFLKDFACTNGYGEYAQTLEPKPEAGWRTIDKQIGKLRQVMVEAGLEVPKSPSNNL